MHSKMLYSKTPIYRGFGGKETSAVFAVNRGVVNRGLTVVVVVVLLYHHPNPPRSASKPALLPLLPLQTHTT